MPSIYESFVSIAGTFPEKPLFELPDGQLISYARTLASVERLASVLTAIGVAPGDRVAVQVGKSPDAIALYLATLQVGGVFLPLNVAYTGAEIDYFLEDAQPRLFVCAPETSSSHNHRAGPDLTVETLGTGGDGSLMDRAASGEPSTDAHSPDLEDCAAILYTSGTTGRPKGAMLTHRNISSNCSALVASWKFTAEDRLIHALPIFHIHGLFVAVNMAVTSGATLVFLSRFDPELVIDLMKRGTVLMGVPTFYTRLLQSGRLDRAATSAMRLFVSGSAPLLPEDHRAFSARTGHDILERYGMTETCMIASNPYDGYRIPGAVGMPLPGVSIRVVDRETGDNLPDGETGAIEVKGPNVFSGYWNMPEKTAEEFREDGYFKTGDIGQIGPDGYLRISGREKDLVISGGYNIYPKEVEDAINALPGVLESAVIGLPHEDLGEYVAAIVVPQPGEQVVPQEISAALSCNLAKYKLPRWVIVESSLPRNTMGKVQKAELRAKYQEIMAETASNTSVAR